MVSFSENLGVSFAIFFIAPRNDSNSVIDFVSFDSKIDLIFFVFGFIPRSIISFPSQVVRLRKNSNFSWLAR